VFELDRDIQNLPGSTAARQRLISASLEYLEGLASSAYGDLDLAQEMADGYERVAKVQGVPTNLNLGQFDKAESSLKKADAFIEIVLTSRPQSRQALLTASNISHDRMILAQSEHRRQDALAYARKSSDRVEALLRLEGLSDSERADATKTYANIALAYLNMHLYSEGIRYAKRSVDLSRSLSPRARYGLSLSTGLSLLANALRYQGDLEGALSTIQEARSIAEKSVYTNDTVRMIDLYGILYREGLILGEERGINLNRPEDAIEPLQQAFDLTESAARKDANDYTSRSREATCGTHLANILRDRG
jgi:tetratricopeptide (TPR) repeat protein